MQGKKSGPLFALALTLLGVAAILTAIVNDEKIFYGLASIFMACSSALWFLYSRVNTRNGR